MQSTILIIYSFCEIQEIVPHKLLAVDSVFALKSSVRTQFLLCKWAANIVAWPVNTVELKYQQTVLGEWMIRDVARSPLND